jgi:hypothetical protein
LKSLDLDLRSCVNFCTTHTSPVGSPSSLASIDGRHVLFRRPCIRAWHARAREFVSFSGAWWPRISLHPSPALVFGGSWQFFAIPAGERLSKGSTWSSRTTTSGSQSLPSIGSVLLFLLLFFYVTWVIVFLFGKLLYLEIVLASLFPAIIFSDSNNGFTVPAIFWWLLQISSGDAVGLVLICFPFTFKTALYNHLKGPGHLFAKFFNFCIYFSSVLVWFGIINGKDPPL